MKHPERLEDYLEHISEAIERAAGYLDPIPDLNAFQKTPMVQDAIIRNIEIIGEAVSKLGGVAPEFIVRHPEIPWAQIRAMRNIAIHEYFYVDLEIVWKTVKHDFPVLKQQIDGLLRQKER